MMGNILPYLVKGLSQIQNVPEKFEKRETAFGLPLHRNKNPGLIWKWLPEAYSESCQIFKMYNFEKIVTGF